MEQGLKERLVGAAVIVILAVIFIPMLLDDSEDGDILITETNIPPKPENMPVPPEGDIASPGDEPQADGAQSKSDDFSSRIVPLQQQEPVTGQPANAAATETEPVSKLPADKPVAEAENTHLAEPVPPKQTGAAMTADTGESETGVGLSAWVVQLGSFSSAQNAEALNQKLRKAGFHAFVEPLKQNNTMSYRVRVGPEIKRSDADTIKEQLEKDLQLEGIVVHYP